MAVLNAWRSSDLFTTEERLALDYAEKMTHTDAEVSDDLFASLRGVFSDAQIVELTLGIALENMRSKFNPTLKIESQGFCAIDSSRDQ